MKAHRRVSPLPILAAVTAAIGLTAGAAMAAESNLPPAQQATVAAGDQLADADADRNLHRATSSMSAHNRRAARDRLERAETALLNRQVLDLGADLNPNEPIPRTAAMEDIVNARTALASRDVPEANQLAHAAEKDVTSQGVQ